MPRNGVAPAVSVRISLAAAERRYGVGSKRLKIQLLKAGCKIEKLWTPNGRQAFVANVEDVERIVKQLEVQNGVEW